MDVDSVSVHKHAKKNPGQYSAILTSRFVNDPYIQGFVNIPHIGSKRYMKLITQSLIMLSDEMMNPAVLASWDR